MKQIEKIAAAAAAGLFIAVLAWTFFSKGPASRVALSVEAESAFEAKLPQPVAMDKQSEWGQPVPQGGPNWIFDIFTPPVIYYDEATGAFTVTPPFPDAGPAAGPFALRLVAIEPEPFRFQLVSYAGSEGNYVLTLENLETGRDVFCTPGEALPGQGLRILGFVEKREIAVSGREGTTEAFDLTGVATVLDERSGKQFTLRHTDTTYLDEPVSRFVSADGQTVYLRPGESWISGMTTYTLQSVDGGTQTATVEKTSSDVGDKVIEILHISTSFNSSDLSNRSTRQSDPQPGAF